MTLPNIDELIEKEWRCFFCDEVFTDPNLARDHFGHGGFWEPGCVQKMVQSDKSIRAELVRTEQYYRDALRQRDEAAAALSTLQEQKSKLEEALKPFADEADEWGHLVPDDHFPLCVEMGHTNGRYYGSAAKYAVGDLRRARALLSGGGE